jgi:16S rRNA (cytidine1402-2'-O)-methyltransferase
MGEDKLDAGLFIVSTPIGNLRDITFRAADTLRAADLIACEDTRMTKRLLSALGIDGALSAYHEHNAAKMRPRLIERMHRGDAVALVSDAGTPLISDPGYKLVRACHDAGIAVTVLPGPSAVMAGLVLSGLPTDRFQFCGFPSSRRGARRAMLEGVAGIGATLVFFESARRLPACLSDMADIFGDREAAVARELTKLHEEVRRGALGVLARGYEDGPPRGEVVIVVAAPGESAVDFDVDEWLRGALSDMSVRDAASAVAIEAGVSRRDAYRRALAIAQELADAHDDSSPSGSRP